MMGPDASLAMQAGRLLRRERGRQQMSQARLAQRLGASQQWISQVERGIVATSTTAVDRIFAALGLTLRLDIEPASRIRLARDSDRAAGAHAGPEGSR
jgi:transcriptional regulator with XRE-family HTH domain